MRSHALKFIILLGVVSLFADVTYEGARSITGQYLAVLGASGAVVGAVAGFGEFIGYGFRLASGFLSDKTKQYWLFTLVGYAINLLAVPMLALAGNWPAAASLILLERFGKALRSPAKDAMLSYAAKEVGRGWGFGLHEAMDQIGAVLGPLVISLILYFQGTYQMAFAALLIPAIFALAVLGCARFLYPSPQKLEVRDPPLKTKGFSSEYWLYLVAISCIAFGYVDFPLIAFHFEKIGTAAPSWAPLFFSMAMGSAGLASLIFGKLYDIKGVTILIVSSLIALFFVPLVFLGGFYLSLFGMILWGIGLGAQESVLRAHVANLTAVDRRGTAYGVFNLAFGLSWFLGSTLLGFLYDLSILALVICSMAAQLLSIPLLILLKK
jgi:MFS family permease